jgi:malonyl CoA-acyl carrier protein transacylase
MSGERRVACFPGQGIQHVGMGAATFRRFPYLVEMANRIVGHPLDELCLYGPAERLDDTRFTQPAIYLVNALTYRAAFADRPPDVALGHSLGEYNALEAAGAIDFATGLRLVRARAAAMARIGGGGMLAVIGLTEQAIRDRLDRTPLRELDLANLNSTYQHVLSGPGAALDTAARTFEEAGATLVKRLAVSGPAHSRYMEPAAREFRQVIDACAFRPLAFQVVSNRTAAPFTVESIGDALVEQLTHPVRWHESIVHVLDDGAAEFVEVGDSSTLTSLIRHIRRDLPATA